MKRFKLLNKCTSDQKLNCIFSFIFVIVGFSSFSYANEIGNGNGIRYTDKQHDDNRCDTKIANFRSEQKEFKKACSAAKLGGVKSCEKKLAQCAKSPEKKDFCLSDAVSTETERERVRDAEDREEKLEDRKEDLQADIAENEEALLEARREVDAADQQLQETLSSIESQKAQAQIQLNEELDNITEQVAQQKDQIATAQLQLQQFVLENETRCREEASAERTRYIQEYQQRRRQGRGATLNQSQLFNRAGLSLNEQGSVRYAQVVKNCTALVNSRGQRTGFGSSYRQQKKLIRQQQAVFRRGIARLNRQRVLVKRGMLATLRNLDDQQKIALSNNQRAKLASVEKQQSLLQNANRLQSQLDKLNGQIRVAGFAIDQKQVEGLLSRGKKRKTDKKNKVATDSQIEAFNTAASLYDESIDFSGSAENACKDKAELVKAEKELEKLEVPTINAIATAKEAKKAAEKSKKKAKTKKKAKGSGVGQTVGRPN